MAAIVLEYELSASWNRNVSDTDLRLADESALRYRFFLGDVVFSVDGADFSARWGWVPVLDFALSLRVIAASLRDGVSVKQAFEFTESDAELHFDRDGPIVKIGANYVAAAAEVSPIDLSLHAERFLSRVVRELGHRYPSLAENAFVSALSRDLAGSS